MLAQLTKKAGPESSTDNFESGMSQLSRQSLHNRSPLAAKAEVGFQLLDKNDEGDTAVGVFGLRLGKQLAYVPAFFLNGEIKTEHLYLLGRDQFVPLSDEWVQAVSKGQFDSYGRGVSRTQSHKGLGYVDLHPLIRPTYKAGQLGLPDDLKQGLPQLAKAAVTASAGIGETTPLRESLQKYGRRAYERFAKFGLAHPTFMQMVDAVYGDGTVQAIILDGQRIAKRGFLEMPHSSEMNIPPEAASTNVINPYANLDGLPAVEDAAPPQSSYLSRLTGDFQNWTDQNFGFLPDSLPGGRATALLGGAGLAGLGLGYGAHQLGRRRRRNDDMQDEMLSKMGALDRRGPIGPAEELLEGPDARKKKLKPKSALTVMTTEEVITAKKAGWTVSDDMIKQAITSGVVVRDARETVQLSTAVEDKQAEKFWTSPHVPGVYEVVLADGEIRKCAVLMPEVGLATRNGFCLLIAIDGGKDYYRGPALKVVTVDRDRFEAEKELKDWFESLSDASIGSGLMTVISQQLTYATPFESMQKIGDSLYEGCVAIHDEAECDAVKHRDRWMDHSAYNHEGDPIRIHKTGQPGKTVVWSGRELVVPSTAKAIKLGKKLPLGSSRLFYEDLLSKSASLKLSRVDSTRVSANGFTRSEQDIALHLANDWCLPYETAVKMAKEATYVPTSYRVVPSLELVKEAYGPFENQDQGLVQTPVLPHEETYSSMPARDGRSVSISHGTEQLIPSRTAESHPPQYDSSDGGYGPSTLVGMDDLDRARQGGRELFDVAALAPLMDAESTESMVDNGMNDLFKGLHRLMSILFSLYRRYDQFVERYGDQDAGQLEESLRSLSTKLGKVILALRQKSIDPMSTPNPGDLGAE